MQSNSVGRQWAENRKAGVEREEERQEAVKPESLPTRDTTGEAERRFIY